MLFLALFFSSLTCFAAADFQSSRMSQSSLSHYGKYLPCLTAAWAFNPLSFFLSLSSLITLHISSTIITTYSKIRKQNRGTVVINVCDVCKDISLLKVAQLQQTGAGRFGLWNGFTTWRRRRRLIIHRDVLIKVCVLLLSENGKAFFPLLALNGGIRWYFCLSRWLDLDSRSAVILAKVSVRRLAARWVWLRPIIVRVLACL